MKTLLFIICGTFIYNKFGLVAYTLASHAYIYPFNENNTKNLDGLN